MAKPTLDRLVLAIHKLGFAVTLTPLDSLTSAAEPAPKRSALADRIGNDAPDVETVEVHGTTITRVVGSVSKDAPLGRDVAGKPLAPFGMLSDGSRPRKSPAGRPKVSSKPAAQPAQPAPKSEPAPAAPASLGSLDFSDVFGDVAATPPAPKSAPPAADDVLDDLEMELADL